MKSAHLKLSILASGFLFCIDQFLKYLARIEPGFAYYLWKPWLGWEFLANQGMAFSIPFPNVLLLVLTPAVIVGLIFWVVKKRQEPPAFYFALLLIIGGAVSNLLDRIFFAAAIDYLRFFTGVVNLADAMVAAGAGILFILYFAKKNQD